jgi:hypothetical protein
MRYVQYRGPHDASDQVLYRPGHPEVPVDLRGNVVQVTNEVFEELQTYPNHTFVEVPDDQAKALKERQGEMRANREGLEKLRADHEAQFAAPPEPASVEEQIAALTAVMPEIAPSATRSASDIKSEVAQETKALSSKAGATSTTPVTPTTAPAT